MARPRVKLSEIGHPGNLGPVFKGCLLCGGDVALVGLFFPNYRWRKHYGVNSTTAIAYGLCEDHNNANDEFTEAIEDRIGRDRSADSN